MSRSVKEWKLAIELDHIKVNVTVLCLLYMLHLTTSLIKDKYIKKKKNRFLLSKDIDLSAVYVNVMFMSS